MATAAAAAKQAVIVVGGAGALGKSVVQRLRSSNTPLSVINLDYLPNPDATHSVPLMPATATVAWHETAAHALTEVRALLRLDSGPALECRALLHVAGGWCGGGVCDAGFLESVDRMWRFNVQSAALAAHMAGVFMVPSLLPPTVQNELKSSSSSSSIGGGLVVLTGAAAALDPSICSGMVGYGFSKTATHFLVKTLAMDPGLREGGVTALSMLPSTIDTPANRMVMPDADFGTWTKVSLDKKEEERGREGRKEGVTTLLNQGEGGKERGEGVRRSNWREKCGTNMLLSNTYTQQQPEEIAEKLAVWVEDASQRPPSGSLVKVSFDGWALCTTPFLLLHLSQNETKKQRTHASSFLSIHFLFVGNDVAGQDLVDACVSFLLVIIVASGPRKRGVVFRGL